MSPNCSTWQYDSTTIFSGKLRFLHSSPPTPGKWALHGGEGLWLLGLLACSWSRPGGMHLCLKTTTGEKTRPAGIKIPANAPSRGGWLSSCLGDQQRSCVPPQKKTVLRLRGSAGTRGLQELVTCSPRSTEHQWVASGDLQHEPGGAGADGVSSGPVARPYPSVGDVGHFQHF